MEIAIDEKTRLQIRRVYQASVATVYAAWTDPEQVKHWMGPSDDFGEAEVTSDVRVGGMYREIVPNKKLVYTWAWESTPERESLVTVEFKPSGNGTELVLTHEQFADSEARDKHQHGWNGCMDRLGRFLSH